MFSNWNIWNSSLWIFYEGLCNKFRCASLHQAHSVQVAENCTLPITIYMSTISYLSNSFCRIFNVSALRPSMEDRWLAILFWLLAKKEERKCQLAFFWDWSKCRKRQECDKRISIEIVFSKARFFYRWYNFCKFIILFLKKISQPQYLINVGRIQVAIQSQTVQWMQCSMDQSVVGISRYQPVDSWRVLITLKTYSIAETLERNS